MRFYKCSICGKIVAVVNEGAGETICCNLPMEELTPKTEEGALDEKHIPVLVRENNKLTVFIGELPHPMDTNHHIEWIALCTNKGNQRKYINNQKEAKVTFNLDPDEKVLVVYAYCNIHGLWKRDLCACTFRKDICACMK